MSMKAVLLKRAGDRSGLYIGDAERPVLKPDHVLIKVRAFGLNRADIVQREGRYPPPPGASDILGLEVAGEIVELASSITFTPLPTALQVGQRVMALLSGGGYAEYAVAHVGCVVPLPASYSFEQGAATIEVYLTAFQLLSFVGKVQPGEVVLLHAGASGVGTAAVQLAKHVFDVRIIVTAGSDEKLTYCKQHGADGALNYKTAGWASSVKSLCQSWSKSGVDLVLDPVGQSHAAANVDVLAVDGRWILFGLMSGGTVSNFQLDPILRKRLLITATTLRARSPEYKGELVRAFRSRVYDALESGKLKMTIDRVFTMEQIQDAHQHMEEDKSMGKIICTVGSEDE